MKTPLFWCIVAAVAVWQLELAVHSGIAASRRQSPPPKSSTTVCTGTQCHPSQPQPTRVTPAR